MKYLLPSESLFTSFPFLKKLYSYRYSFFYNYSSQYKYNSIDLLIEPIDPIIDELRYKRDIFKI